MVSIIIMPLRFMPWVGNTLVEEEEGAKQTLCMNNLIELIEYNTWANKRILSQVKSLAQKDLIKDTDGCFASLRHAIIHLLRSDWIWLDRWLGQDFVEIPEQWNDLMIEDIQSIWSAVQANIIDLLKSKLVEEADELITISNEGEYKLMLELRKTINLVVNHGAYHRGQIVNTIKMLGLQPIKTQLLEYYRRRREFKIIL